jgi:DNA-binding MarR family transcriptional regulator
MSPAATGTADKPALPLTALLSQALVAFTIEFDNEAERQIPHSTARHGSTAGGVWLVSMAMWLNCMRYVSADPITVGELARLARCATNVDGMRRWGYVKLTPDPADTRARPPADALLIAATTRGQRAQEVWGPLTAVVEARWRDRFGAAEIGQLITALSGLTGQLGDWLPDCLPILGHGLYSRGNGPGGDRFPPLSQASELQSSHDRQAPPPDTDAPLPLPWLLARVLLAVAIEFERESAVSLAIAADLLRVLDDRGVRVRDLSALSGVSKEALAMATGYAGKRGLIVIETGAESKFKIARLTSKGLQVQQQYADLLASLTARWRDRFGTEAIGDLRGSLERLVGAGGPQSPLFTGLRSDPGGWRAAVRPPLTLPHFPMVLHRGGYPDGS